MTPLPTMITCAYCGGHAFTLVILLNGGTALRCVNHDDHVEELDIAGRAKAIEEEMHRQIAEEDAERKRKR